jgi:hypothetical protein
VDWLECGNTRNKLPGKNTKKLFESLRNALQEALEINRKEALKEAGNDYKEEKIAL